MPINKRYPLAELLDACETFVHARQKMITFEYILIDGVNDDPAQATLLAAHARRLRAKVNLIPFNPVPGIDLEASEPDVLDAFRDTVLSAGIMTVTRRTRGADIDAACGQLAGQFLDRTRRSNRLS